jgi:hypothetical protein
VHQGRTAAREHRPRRHYRIAAAAAP